ncbi:MAG: GNAT family N-acetyltransferase [Streptococcus sp.]|nr:GNAT family N-acetyltransferase [Streptococcus sp.]
MTRLTLKTIYPLTPLFWKTKKLYESAFPAIERISLAWMMKISLLKQADFYAYFDGDTFCGFTYSLHSEKAYYLLFLAVSEEIQSQGYGGKIVSEVAKKADDRPVFLVMEPLDQQADNYRQRIRRLAFYEKNGYHLTDYLCYEGQEVYQVLTKQEVIDIAPFEKLAKKIEQTGLTVRIEKLKKNEENDS